MKQARLQASVQRDMLYLRGKSGDMLCLYAPGSPTRRSHRAVLEVAPINLALKAEDEQEAIIERFGALMWKEREQALCWWETGTVCERRYRVHDQWYNLRPD